MRDAMAGWKVCCPTCEGDGCPACLYLGTVKADEIPEPPEAE